MNQDAKLSFLRKGRPFPPWAVLDRGRSAVRLALGRIHSGGDPSGGGSPPLSGEDLLFRAVAGAKDFAQTVIGRHTEMQIVGYRRDHQAAVQTRAADPFNGPQPVSDGAFQIGTAFVRDNFRFRRCR